MVLYHRARSVNEALALLDSAQDHAVRPRHSWCIIGHWVKIVLGLTACWTTFYCFHWFNVYVDIDNLLGTMMQVFSAIVKMLSHPNNSQLLNWNSKDLVVHPLTCDTIKEATKKPYQELTEPSSEFVVWFHCKYFHSCTYEICCPVQ